MRVVVVGAAGQLGRELVRALPPTSTVALSRADLDVRDRGRGRARARGLGPAVVVNAAADNRVDHAERVPGRRGRGERPRRGGARRRVPRAGRLARPDEHRLRVRRPARQPYPRTTRRTRSAPMRARSSRASSSRARSRRVTPCCAVAGLYAAGGSQAKGGSFVDRVLAQARERCRAARRRRPGHRAHLGARRRGRARPCSPRLVRGDAPAGVYH
jgi:hypothetical protein